ncbi:MAG TPA: helix-turn-helix transcriptional regulator [Allosphingosinicella sp.]
MNIRQCRMARAALDWSQADLAKAAGVSARTVIRYEAGESVLADRVRALRAALEAKGVVFVGAGQFAGAVAPPCARETDSSTP